MLKEEIQSICLQTASHRTYVLILSCQFHSAMCQRHSGRGSPGFILGFADKPKMRGTLFRGFITGRAKSKAEAPGEAHFWTYFLTSMVNSAPYMLPWMSAVMPSGPVESSATA